MTMSPRTSLPVSGSNRSGASSSTAEKSDGVSNVIPGKDKTSVTRSIPRKSLFSSRICSSPTTDRETSTSYGHFSRRRTSRITLRAVTRMEKSNFSRLATSVISVTLLIILIRLYNLLDNRVPYNISGVQCNERNAFNAPSCKDPRRDVKS